MNFNNCRLYIFGGHDIREGSLKNMWMLDLNDFNDLDLAPEDQIGHCEWKLLNPKDTPLTVAQ